MRILYVCRTDLAGRYGSPGSARHVMEVCENLSRLGSEVRLIAPAYGRWGHATRVRMFYVPLIRLRFLRTVSYELMSVFVIAFHLLAWRPDAVYWRQALLSFFPVLLARLFRCPIVTEVNGFTLQEIEAERISRLRKRAIRVFERFNYVHSSRIICVAPDIMAGILKNYPVRESKVCVIPNGVNTEGLPVIDPRDAKRRLGFAPDTPVVGFVGYFFPWDGLEYLIEAAPSIAAEVPTVRFLIVGHGKWGRHLPDLAAKKGVGVFFIFPGYVPWEELYRYINAFDVAVAPYARAVNSISGRSSLKMLEYFACGKPVVASRTTALPEIVAMEERRLGIAVPPEDPNALAEAVLRLLKNPELRAELSRGARQYVEAERTWRTAAEKIMAVIEKECYDSVD